jgi:phospholipid/cholesterol/gamma-HCH transport system permease protein
MPSFDTEDTYRYNFGTVTTESTLTDEGGSTPPDPEHDHQTTTETVLAEAEQAIEEAGHLTFGLVRDVVVSMVSYLGEVFLLLVQSVRGLRRGVNVGDVLRQMSVIGVESIPISLLTVGFSGAVLALYTVGTLKTYGASGLVGGIVALSIVRETGPILTGVSIAARAGSAITAEIGSMKVTEQVDALRSMAVSPTDYLVTPRLIASLIMLPLVCIWSDVAGVLGGAIVASSKGVSFSAYQESLRLLMEPDGSDVTRGLIKTVAFGAIIALVGCREGLETKGGATGVGQATTRSVVLSIVLIFLADFLLTFLLFNSGLL